MIINFLIVIQVMMKRSIKWIIFLIVASVISAFLFSFDRMHNIDFVAYNGDFQNYNIFRRVIDGQFSYKDFINYLGLGVVIINLPFVALFNSFGNSVFITNFTTSIIFSIMIFLLVYLLSEKLNFASAITILTPPICYILLNTSIFTGSFYYKYIYDILFMSKIGHSMRTTRAFLPFLVVLFLSILKRIKGKNDEKFLLEFFSSITGTIIIGALSGFLIIWSNDFGFACVGVLFILQIILQMFLCKNNLLKQFCVYGCHIVSVLVGYLIAIIIVTGGSITKYISITKEIADYQFWYYGNVPSKLFTLKEIFLYSDYGLLTVLFFGFAFKFLYDASNNKLDDRAFLLFFLQSSCYAASLIYVIGSGAHNKAAVQFVLYVSLIFVVFKYGRKVAVVIKEKVINRNLQFLNKIKCNKLQNKKLKGMVLVGLYVCLLIGSAKVFILRNDSQPDKEYISGLKIYSSIARGLNASAEKYKDVAVFSTYSTALETINNQFQPTGTDYIIHVLGDQARQKYLDTFIKNDYECVSTLKNDYTCWEYWATRSNWFFYRELYKNYEPKDQTRYSVYWNKTDEPNIIKNKEYNIKVVCLDETSVRVEVEIPDYYNDAYVDLKISYASEWTNNRIRELAIRKCVCVFDDGNLYNNFGGNSCYYLPEETDGTYIPIYLRNGKGSITISTNPTSCTKLLNFNVEVDSLIKPPEFDLTVADYNDIELHISDSISTDRRTLKFINTESNYSKLIDAAQLKIHNKIYNIETVYLEDNYICIHLCDSIEESEIKYVQYPYSVDSIKGYKLANITDNNWVSGVCRYESKVVFDSRFDTNNLKALKCNGKVFQVEGVEFSEKYCWIKIKNPENLQQLAYPQSIELIYE